MKKKNIVTEVEKDDIDEEEKDGEVKNAKRLKKKGRKV